MLDFANIDKDEMLSCIYSKKLLEKLRLVNAELLESEDQIIDVIDIEEVEKGICYAKYYHADQMRESGEPYYSHPLEVAYMVLDHLPRTDIIITAILHDTLEDTSLTREKIAEVFGEKIAEKVYDLTRIKTDGVKISSAQMVEELWLAKKYDVLLIKLFDRIHNMQTINSKSPDKIKKIMAETIETFLILSIEHGMSDVYQILRSICLAETHIINMALHKKYPTISPNNYQLPALNLQNVLNQEHKQ
jgi:(p)ppGpp synthase/HD superfamily hydrolase